MIPVRFRSSIIGFFFVCTMAMASCAVLGGCDEDYAVQQRQKLVEARDKAVLDGNLALADSLSGAIVEADKAIGAVKTDPVATTAEGIQQSPLVNFVPEPFRTPVVLGIGLFAAIWRMVKWKQAAVSIAKSMEKAMPDAPFKDNATVALIDANQTPLAKKAVDIAQGKTRGILAV